MGKNRNAGTSELDGSENLGVGNPGDADADADAEAEETAQPMRELTQAERVQIESAVAGAMGAKGNIDNLLIVATDAFGWDEACLAYAANRAAATLVASKLTIENLRLTAYIDAFTFDAEMFEFQSRPVLRVKGSEVKTSRPASATSGAVGARGQSLTVIKDGETRKFASAAKGRDALLVNKIGSNMSRSAIVSALKSIGWIEVTN